jgi:crotonobetainyl-CoA:carnitine CoA-transferase CaiB-like acyl-CoA transferase
VAHVSDFGDDGSYRDWRSTVMIHQALAGIMRRNGVSGREPVHGCGDRASYGAGVAAYIDVLEAFLA